MKILAQPLFDMSEFLQYAKTKEVLLVLMSPSIFSPCIPYSPPVLGGVVKDRGG